MSEVGAGLDLSGSLSASLGGLTAAINGLSGRMDRREAFLQKANQAIRQIPFQCNTPIVSSAGSLNPSTQGPDLGYYWSIRRITAQGFTAGTVTVYIDNTNGEPIMPFPQTAVNTLGKGELLLHPGSALAVNCTSITSANNLVTIYGAADCIESWLLPFYLGGFWEGA